MEESTQRRERLKAMRMEASQQDATSNINHSAVSLSNPLLESTTNAEIQVQTSSQSFNYYTNPMAAYSGNKQRSQVSPQTSQNISSTPRSRNEAFPPPSLQPHINQSPNPPIQQAHGYYANSNAYSSSPQQSSTLPNPSWRGNSPQPRGYYGPRGVGFPSLQTHFTSGSGQGGYHSPGSSPHFTNNAGRGSGRGYPSPGPNFRNSPNHGPDQGGYPGSGSNQERGYGLGFGNNMSPGPGSGRGRGRGSGLGGGRGRGQGHNHVSADDRPDRFFNKSMVEDPWEFLEPVIWKSLKKKWFPPSLNAKKPRVSESPRQSSSQPSLAEILAASFNEAANDEPNAE